MFRQTGGKNAVAPIVGFLLIVALATTGILIVQTTVFDPLNFDAEDKHHDKITEKFDKLTVQTQDTIDSGIQQGSDMELQVDYPAQPSPPFTRTQSIRLQRVTEGLERSSNNNQNSAVKFTGVNASSSGEKIYNTTYLKMNPEYVEYKTAPDLLSELGIVATSSRASTQSAVVSQDFVKNDSAFFIPELTGTQKSQVSSESVSLTVIKTGELKTNILEDDTTTASAPEMTVKTSFSETTWDRLFEDRPEEVTQYDRFPGLNEVTIKLDENKNEYKIQTAPIRLKID